MSVMAPTRAEYKWEQKMLIWVPAVVQAAARED